MVSLLFLLVVPHPVGSLPLQLANFLPFFSTPIRELLHSWSSVTQEGYKKQEDGDLGFQVGTHQSPTATHVSSPHFTPYTPSSTFIPCHEVTRQFDSDSDRMGRVFNQPPAVCSNRRLIGLLAQWFRPLSLKGTVISSQCWLVGLVTSPDHPAQPLILTQTHTPTQKPRSEFESDTAHPFSYPQQRPMRQAAGDRIREEAYLQAQVEQVWVKANTSAEVEAEEEGTVAVVEIPRRKIFEKFEWSLVLKARKVNG
ncbi:hypothetical protein TREMEDRAFT_64665 [Tremella mesenterica DSM 1558]|uniref:uncharacterized protein n=1 Tax=Tremella mesenterica (strain ATCC 24925 / CBS 8224 / DSM 1558 / NBRC 9311 / NRRL Y-6157 / RJB 2259-6 / UBC 559-6) TaxID=578456 RepID=UPI0003F49155|nr:uncharacterized protein TREMEDRAFT_64665 [Tremella mesenterica DSM 1558]EIW67409.1 hypothetical protein TREMEDRAFT_64665 [Tremella mesenterica DSM 1558]